MIGIIKSQYSKHLTSRITFLRLLTRFSLGFGVCFIVCFLYIGAYLSALFTSTVLLITLVLRYHLVQRNKPFHASVCVSISWLVEPTSAIVFSQGVASPYLIWLIVPIFAVSGLLGAWGGIIAAFTGVMTYLILIPLDSLLVPLNELNQSYYSIMHFISNCSAAAFTALLAYVAVDSIERESEKTAKVLKQKQKINQTLQTTLELLQKEVYERDRIQAVISHELRTPAATLKLLFDKDIKPQLTDSTNSTVNDLLEHMISIMEEMRLSERSQFMTKEKNQTINLYNLVSQAVEITRLSINKSNLDVKIHHDNGKDDLVLAPTKVCKQIIANLIKNCAIHANASVLNIYLKTVERESNYYCTIKFVDDGTGIKNDYLPYIFDEFVRSDSMADGSGIGLSLSKELAKNFLNGDLTYAHAQSGGAEFTLTAIFKKAPRLVKSESSLHFEDALHGFKILLVEDSDILRMLTKTLLDESGAIVTEAINGLEAEKLCKTKTYDLVMTDLHMPNMNGIELTKRLRSNQYSSPIIGITSANEIECKEWEFFGVNATFVKPIEMNKLKQYVASLKNDKSESAKVEKFNAVKCC